MLSGHVVFLLYLNNKTFLDAGGAVARLAQAAMGNQRITIAMPWSTSKSPAAAVAPFAT